jgi:hypothetical protein
MPSIKGHLSFFEGIHFNQEDGLNILAKEQSGSTLLRGGFMKEKTQAVVQPEAFTPGITKGMVRQHAYRLYRDKLEHGGLTLEDWVLAEKDLVQTRLTEGVEA